MKYIKRDSTRINSAEQNRSFSRAYPIGTIGFYRPRVVPNNATYRRRVGIIIIISAIYELDYMVESEGETFRIMQSSFSLE